MLDYGLCSEEGRGFEKDSVVELVRMKSGWHSAY